LIHFYKRKTRKAAEEEIKTLVEKALPSLALTCLVD